MSSTNLEQQTFSLSESAESFLFDRTSRGRSPRTVGFYRAELGYFEKWLNRPLEVEKLTPDILRRYFVDLATHRNKGGVHCSYRVIKAYLNFIWDENDLDIKNPIKKVKISPNKIPPLPEIPLADIQKLLAAVSDRMRERDTAILKCLVDSGCRAQELLDLNVGDVNMTSGSVLIKHGKGDKYRTTFLGKSARKALSAYLATRQGLTPESPLFLNDTDERLKFFGLRQMVCRLCRRVGIPEYGLHAFRRCFAISCFRAGMDVMTVSRLLGHVSVEVTKRYLCIGNSDLQKAHNLVSPADTLL